MSGNETLQDDLDRLGHELSGSPDFVPGVMERLEGTVDRKRCRILPFPIAPRAMPGLAAAAAIALCVFAWWLSQPPTVYARMLRALANAETVHVSGWTQRVVRKWPLEKPVSNEKPADAKAEKHPVDVWYWTAPDGTPRSYERQGPVVAVREGGELEEYQEDVDLLFVSAGHGKDRVSQYTDWVAYLKLLDRPSLEKRDLGTRNEDGRLLRGIRLVEGNRIEDFWYDEETGLPRRQVRIDQQSGEPTMELTFAVNEPVPETIAAYEPPPTETVRYGHGHKDVNLAWRRHVQEIDARLQDNPPEGGVALLPREDGKTFPNQWTLRTPGGNYWVMPLDIDQYQQMDLPHFIRNRVATDDGERRHGTWRVPQEFHDFEFPRADLVYEDGTPWREWMAVALDQFDLELVDRKEMHTIWVAKYDGRPLKPWQEVTPPVPYIIEGGVEKKGVVRPGIGHVLRPVTMQELFRDFNRLIDSHDFMADKPWIVDETGLPQPPPYNESEHGTRREYRESVIEPEFLVATDSPWFVGNESLQMAQDWYRAEFGVTFEEVERPVTVHVIRRKQ